MALQPENYNPALRYGARHDGDNVANVAAEDTQGGIPVVFQVDTDGSGSSTTNITVDNKVRIIDAWCVLQGAGDTSDTVTVQNVGNAITDAMDVSGSDKALVRAGEIDDAQHEIDAGGTLRVVHTDAAGSNAPIISVYVHAIRVA